MWKLTFHLNGDGPRLHHCVADAQSAAILPSIHSLHTVNAVIQYTKTLVNLCIQHLTPLFNSMCYLPDSGEESYDHVCDGLELVDHHLCVWRQVQAVLHPEDGGLQPGIGDVDGAVEFSLMAL